jgi:hypothetical protein
VTIRALLDVSFSVIFLCAIYAVSEEKSHFVIALILAIPAVLTYWFQYLMEAPGIRAVGDVFSVFFYIFIITRTVSYLFRVKEVTFDLITGAVCGYFIMGMMWTNIYSALEYIMPGSFALPTEATGAKMHFFYYSFVTLTTLGYGDITPLSSAARSLAVLESVAGQIYLAVIIARLVGLSIVDFQERT